MGVKIGEVEVNELLKALRCKNKICDMYNCPYFDGDGCDIERMGKEAAEVIELLMQEVKRNGLRF